MAKVKLITDSAADLSQELYDKYNIAVVPFSITFDKVRYYRERLDISNEEFFEKLKTEKSFPATSLPSINDYIEGIRPFLRQGMDIVCLSISSKFSGSHQSAVGAVKELQKEFPDREIIAIDTIQASAGQGVMVLETAKMIAAGMSAKETADKLEVIKHTARVILTIDSLEYLQKGGRIGKVSAIAGTLLNIKPIIIMMNAELHPVAKVRGRQKAIERIIKINEEFVGDRKGDYDYLILNAQCYDEAMAVEQKMKDSGFKLDWPIQDLGVTIGCHTGPSVIGICPIKKFDAE
ncbi:MAG: DegV family protein [Clostridiales bacterium]|nr:DegV family protein [Clostridiales bacterium]